LLWKLRGVTHHSDSFAIKETIDYPYLFGEVSSVQILTLDKIQEIDNTPLNLDLREKSMISSTSYVPSLSFMDNMVASQPRHYSSQRNLALIAKNDSLKNYKITREYFDGIKFKEVNILIDTGQMEIISTINYAINYKYIPYRNLVD
jgi:hypothetical protein